MTTNSEQILIITNDQQINFLLERMLRSFGYLVQICEDEAAAREQVKHIPPSLMIISEKVSGGKWEDFAVELKRRFPATPLMLFIYEDSPEALKRAMQAGVGDIMCLPLTADSVVKSVQAAIARAQQTREWVLLEAKRATASLQRRVDELETMARLGRAITGTLDLDSVLASVVDAAVTLTNAEEGSLLLLDEETGELYMRAARNFQEDFVRTFRLPTNNTLAGTVITTGQPVILDENTPKKIKTSYLVQSLVYVPLQLNGRTFGVLGIDNRSSTPVSFKEHDVKLLVTIAEYAVIALENARLYTDSINDRNKLETVLTRVQDGVMVMDQELRLILVNQSAQSALGLPEGYINRPALEIITQPELVELLDTAGKNQPHRTEITLGDGQVFLGQLTPIPEVGYAVTMHDITYLKKLDRIKSDFVSTVSHDLRSPLTAILGYVELIERAGPVTDLQRDFIRRVQNSVHNITHLVDELVNLGRIEAGFDTHKEKLRIEQVIRFSADSMKKPLGEKGHHLLLELPQDLPMFFGNPVQMRQMVDHLLDNSIKYTPAGGTITVHAGLEENQIILQFVDTGIGIPALDLPYIFDKFYRASNSSTESSGTGLGLAIVKSIVENHQGRIWVDSKVGHGSTFTVVLPLVEP